MEVLANFVISLSLALASTLFFALLAKVACKYIDVVSERTVIWCITLGAVLGKSPTADVPLGRALGPEDASELGSALGPLFALLLLWWYLYRRNRDVAGG